MNKRLLYIWVIMTLLLSSCYETRYTHSQVMDLAVLDKTEEEIQNIFGIPSEKANEGYFEEWSYFDFGRKPVTINLPSSGPTNINPSYGSGKRGRDIYEGGLIYRRAGDYIKITFQNGRAVQWSTSGIDYSVEEISPASSFITVSVSFMLLTGLAFLLL